MAADRRRINGPPSGTSSPLYHSYLSGQNEEQRPVRTRKPDEPRQIFLRTGITSSASGSAYLELTPNRASKEKSLIASTSALKLTCTVHGPRPLPRSAPFSPQLVLSTYVKYAPFATRRRRGFIRDAGERDLGKHLETALRSIVIGERWPKSGAEVVITILESEEDQWWADGEGSNVSSWGMMTVLAGCITAASAALVEAGIDCIDVAAGGVAALVSSSRTSAGATATGKERVSQKEWQLVLDPCPAEHRHIDAMCVVGYLQSRDEIIEMWMKGEIGERVEDLIAKAITAATASGSVLRDVLKEAATLKEAVTSQSNVETTKSGKSSSNQDATADTDMTG